MMFQILLERIVVICQFGPRAVSTFGLLLLLRTSGLSVVSASLLLWCGGFGHLVGDHQKAFFVQRLRHAEFVVQLFARVLQVRHGHRVRVGRKEGFDGQTVIQLKIKRTESVAKWLPTTLQ
jgi:hypothetical protein